MTISHTLIDDVAALLRQVAADVVMPRFGTLAAGDIVEKTPGELVTVADREAEVRLTAGLSVLAPDVRVIGEEACAADPSLLDTVGAGRHWLVDPIDGTANYAAGRGPFGLMIALVEDGETVAGWLYDPLHDRLCTAVRGQGAMIDGRSVRAAMPPRDRYVAGLATQFMSAADRAAVEAGGAEHFDLVPIPRCAAEQYPRLVLGENDVALFQRTLPWDHAAGALFVVEAGGVVARWDGTPYRLDDGRTGLLAANSLAAWTAARHALFELGIAPPPFGERLP
ncbi:inositol monophosphatase family protein [Sphingomonas sp.]|uniref:inositol monophosphatase family protein n=1 Tax=Sphingomonas sp. TaxID=28214 RepID=UPI003AFFB740